MSEIFLSYAREDRQAAHAVATALERLGWSVWWDREIVIGTPYEYEIEKALAAAQCVVVLWSEQSIASEWVRNEAGEGARRRILVPARIGDVLPPLAHRGLQTADLAGWRGEDDDERFQALRQAVESMLGRPPAASDRAVAQPVGEPWFRRYWRVLLPGAVLGIVVVALLIALAARDTTTGFSTSRTVLVPGRATWTDTGIDLQAGNAVDFEASGEISGDVGAADQVGKKSGPSGIAGTANNPTYKNVIFEVDHGALIAKVGNDGQPFAVRPGQRYSFDHSGRLYLGVNDTEPCNNGEAYRVVVEVDQQEVAGTPPTPTTAASCV